MKTTLSRLLLGLAGAVGAAFFAVACSQSTSLPVSPSGAPMSGIDGSAAKGHKSFCAYVRAHEADSIYVVGQPVGLALNRNDAIQSETSGPPHGDVCFSIPAAAEYVYLSVDKAGYCTLNSVQFAVHGGPSYIWLLPDNHDCSYDDEPY